MAAAAAAEPLACDPPRHHTPPTAPCPRRQLTGASWVAFALADLYWARTGICQGGVAHNSAAINLGLGAYFL